MTLNLRDLKSPERETYKLVGFTVQNIFYGIDIMRVREVINPIDLVSVPSLPAYVKGVADHRAEVVPIIDLRARFGIDPTRLQVGDLKRRRLAFSVTSESATTRVQV